MKIFKKLLPMLLAAVLLTGAFAACAACAPSEPDTPTNPEEELDGLVDDEPVLAMSMPRNIQFRNSIYGFGYFQDDSVSIVKWIGVLCKAEDYDTCRAKYPDKEIAVDPENELVNHMNDDICFIYSAKGYPKENYILVCGEADGEFGYLYMKEE